MSSAGVPLRVLHVSEVTWGGVVTLLEHFVREQVRAGHEVHVLAPSSLPALAEGATVHPWRLDRRRPWTLLAAAVALRRTVRRTRPDVVHLHSFFAGLVGRAVRRLVLPGTAVVYQPHAWSDRLLERRPGAPQALRAVERRLGRATDLVVANCEDELERGRRIGVAAPGRAVGVAVDLDRFRPPSADEREQARAGLGLPEGRRVVLVLGRLAWQKGQDLLLPAWVRQPPPDSVLVLVGPGEQDDLRRAAGEELDRSVVLAGESADVVPWLWASDVMVLSSRYETVALVVAEAMATGLPVVATAVDGAAEVLHGGSGPAAGAVVDLEATDALVAAAAVRLGDPDLHAREAAAGPSRARELFAPTTVVARLDEAYRTAIATRREYR